MVVNKSYRKMVLRGIKKSLTRFVSILGIVALGSGFLAGLLATTPDMKKSADAYFHGQNTYDMQIQGTLGITKDDISYLNQKKYVKKAEGIYTVDAIMTIGKKEVLTTRIIARDFNDKKRINKTKLIKGRYPKANNECVIAIPNKYKYNHQLQEVITISPKNKGYQNLRDSFESGDFKVVGIVESPQYISQYGEVTSVGDGQISLAVYVKKGAYKKQDVFTAAFVTIEGTKEMSSFDADYKKKTAEVAKTIRKDGIQRSKIRKDTLISEAQVKIDDAKNKYKESKTKAERELGNAKKKLEDGASKISAGRRELSSSENNLNEQERQILEKESQLQSVKPKIEQLKQILDSGGVLPPEAMAQIAQYDKGRAAVASGKDQIATGRKTISAKRKDLDSAEKTLNAGRIQYNDEKKKADLELADADKKIQEAEVTVRDMVEAKWYVRDRGENLGVSNYRSDVEKIGAVSKVFPIFFFMVAVLVALTTMTRMIEEDRGQIGVLKSLGYSNWGVVKYYLIYSFAATFLGCVLGLSGGFVIFPKVISNAYSMMYNLPPTLVEVHWPIAITVTAVIVSAITFTGYLACRSELKEKPALLLLPKAPKLGKRILLERITPIWKRLKFTRKVTLRNLFRYKKRFLMTIIGIAGCFALLLAGFGIRDSISDVVNRQYNEITKYDYKLKVAEEKWIDNDAVISSVLNDKKLVTKYEALDSDAVKVIKDGEFKDCSFIIPRDVKNMSNFFNLSNRESGDRIPFRENSVVLTEKIAKGLNIRVGDRVTLRLLGGQEAKVSVTGIAENYVGNFVYMSPENYKKNFNRAPIYTEILIKSDNKKVVENLLKSDNVQYVLPTATIRDNFRNSVESIDYVVFVLIGSAGALAIIVLYNLTNVNVCERKRELATIKVLGFYEKEVQGYIFREINMLSVMGMLAGIPLGIVLHKFIMKTVEVEAIMFGRNIYWQSYVFSALITIFFTIVVNLIMKKSIRVINMVESMKAND